LQTTKTEAGYNLVSIEKDTIYYRERLSAGKTLDCWCKVPFNKGTQLGAGSGPFRQVAPQPAKPPSGDSLNMAFPEIKTLWSIQDNSDIGTGITVQGKQAVYANTAGEIVSIDLKSGKRIWTHHTGGKIYSTPAVEGNLVVCASTDHNIYCLDLKTGKKKWMHPTIKPIVASPAISEGSVYIGSSDGTFRCLRLENGNLVWSFDSVKNFVECKPVILRNSVCFGSWGNTFYSLDRKSGVLLWKREKYTNRMLSPAAVWPVAADGKIFVVAPDRHMTALDENTGAEIWDSGKYTCRESIGLSRDGKYVYIMNMTEGNVDAFVTSSDKQTLAWECKADLGYEIAPSPIVESGRFVFIPSATGIVTAIDRKTHLVAWKHKVSDALINSVLPVGKNRLLVSAMDGKVVCLSF
jgi:outer membrane protein assembly factor BamB